MTALRISVVTLFPDLVLAWAATGVTGRAIDNALVEVDTVNPRDFTTDRHRSVDDRPYGGGPGMVMKVEPLRQAIAAARQQVAADSVVIAMTPQGRRFDQQTAERLSGKPGMVLVCGRYEGIDERVLECDVDMELSVGDYVLSGGELAALAVAESVMRLIPGVLGDDQSAALDSFSAGLLDYPHYTRPEVVDGHGVPQVLLSGDHEAIRRWRLQQSLGRTWTRRPELLERSDLTGEQRELLDEFIAAAGAGAARAKTQ